MIKKIFKNLNWYFFIYYSILFILPGIINHFAIIIKDYDFTIRNLRNFRPGLAYDLGHGIAGILLPLIFTKIAKRYTFYISIVIFFLIIFYHYIDYCYYTIALTHLPYYLLNYGKQAGNFESSVYFFTFQQAAFWQVIFPFIIMLSVGIFLSKKNKNWVMLKKWDYIIFSLIAILIFLSGNSYGNSYDSKNDENPLMYNVYRFLKITAKENTTISSPREYPSKVLKTWPFPSNSFHYHYYAGMKGYPFLRLQPRVLCKNQKPPKTSLVDFPELAQENIYSKIQNQNSKLRLNLSNSNQTELDSLLCSAKKGERKNIILLILENFRAQSTGIHGTDENLSPNFDKWGKRGVLFTNAFANGTRTKDSMVGIYCSMIHIPFYHIMKYHINNSYMCLPEVLKRDGYYTAWIHNGDANFDFRFEFFKKIGFIDIIDKFQMPLLAEQAGWGPTDEVLFKKTMEYLKEIPRPYFLSILTVTNHHPYEAPKKYRTYEGSDEYLRFRDSMKYTDMVFHKFMEAFMRLPDAAKTVIIVTGDHGNHLNIQSGLEKDNPEKYDRYRAQIPLLIIVPGKFKQIIQKQVVTLLDIPSTITDISGIDSINHWFGLSAFIQDPRKVNISIIDHIYRAFRTNKNTYFNGWLKKESAGNQENSHLFMDLKMEKMLNGILHLNQYLLHQDKYYPAK
jgi:hypothetical protein